MEENFRASGTVQWFSRVKGYGFIRPDGQEEDVFVHYSVINGEGYRNLNKGQRVEFVVEDTPKGPQAVDVVGLDTIVELEPEEPRSEFAAAEPEPEEPRFEFAAAEPEPEEPRFEFAAAEPEPEEPALEFGAIES